MNDYIKREDAIKAMAQYLMNMALIDNPEASNRIEEWESNIAVPVMSTVKMANMVEVVRCKDCRYDHECSHNIIRRSKGGVIYCSLEYCSEGKRKNE